MPGKAAKKHEKAEKPGSIPEKASIFECIKDGFSFLLIVKFPTFQLFGLSPVKKWEKVDK
jgi:hypothetical protein